jgi:hypothetical protein
MRSSADCFATSKRFAYDFLAFVPSLTSFLLSHLIPVLQIMHFRGAGIQNN